MKSKNKLTTLFVACLLLVVGSARAASGRVLVLLSADSDIYEESLVGIRSVIESEVEVEYLNVIIAEQADLARFFAERKKAGVSHIIAIGPAAARAAYQPENDLPVLFSMVSSPKSLKPGNKALCGVSMHLPVAEYFRTLKEISPRARRVHAFYSSEEGEFLAREGDYSDFAHKLLYTRTKITNINDFQTSLDRLKGRTDAFYLVPDPVYNRERFLALSRFCAKNGIILMTSFRSLVRTGATFAFSPDYSKIGALTGRMANRLLAGKSSCAEEGVILPDRSSFFFSLNAKYARESGVKIPESILQRSRQVRLFKAGVNFFNEGKLNAARIVFEELLKKDPGNVTANYYLGIILEKLTGDEIKRLLADAEKFLAEKKFADARDAYRKIMEINPRFVGAKEGFQAALLAQSEYERARGLELEKSGRPFAAVLMLQASLATLPGNDRARSDLNRIRAAQRSRVPELLRNGMASYNRREYANAIKIFENVLLVAPDNKEAREYLRLSRKKRAAILRLMEKNRGK